MRTVLTAILMLAAAMLPRAALALSLEVPPANPDGTSKFVDPDKKWEPFDYKNLSDQDNNNSNQPRGLTFGSPNSGVGSFSFGFGPVQNPRDPFDNSRFFRTGPPGQQ